jgi:hypothetical protein
MGEIVEIRSFRTGQRFRYLIRNIQSLSISLSSPATAMPLPLAGDANNILTKAEGNSCRISVSWIIKDEPTDVILSNTYNTDGGSATGDTPSGLTTKKNADDQVQFLINNNTASKAGFQSTQVEDKYQIILGGVGFSRVGLIESVEVSKSGSTPVTWTANLSFIAGAPVVAGEPDEEE